MKFSGFVLAPAAAMVVALSATAQPAPAPQAGPTPTAATTIVTLPTPLLAPSAAGKARDAEPVTGEDPAQADAAHAAILREDGLQRFARASYGGTPVLALQFNDVSGARAAFSAYLQPGSRFLKPADRGASEVAESGDQTLLLAQSVVLVAAKPGAATLLSGLSGPLPKIGGPRSQPPLLPTIVPRKGLQAGSVRYALGPAGYAAAGGTLQPTQLGWEKSAEAVLAQYADKRGRETLTLLLYPTPQIAGEHARRLEGLAGDSAKLRREGELVMIAQGTFGPDETQNLLENIHMRTEVSFNKEMELSFPSEVRKTYSLLSSILVLSGVLGLAAVMLGLFLGGGRAAFRKMRGKDAATEAEFLSLHLDPQNASPRFDPPSQ